MRESLLAYKVCPYPDKEEGRERSEAVARSDIVSAYQFYQKRIMTSFIVYCPANFFRK
jgi:hypothetical protein